MAAPSQIELTVIVGSMTASGVVVTCVGPNVYRLDEEPALFLEAEDDEEADSYPRFGDVMFAELVGDGTVRYTALHKRGPYKQFCFVLTRDDAESEAMTTFLALVSAEGGHWERHMGGVPYLAIPEGSSIELPSSLFGATGRA